MAITTTTISKSIGWARTDVIDSLEQAFTWLNLHGEGISGIVTSIDEYSGGGSIPDETNNNYFDVPVVATSGIGTGATFDVYRSGSGTGTVSAVRVNRPGKGYVNGEILELSGEDIGGVSNGAAGVGITVICDPSVTYGATDEFFAKDFTPSNDSSRPWGVLKQDFDTSKRFGVTYRGFKVHDDYRLTVLAGSSFQPYEESNTNDKGANYASSFKGTQYLDIPSSPSFASQSLDYTTDINSQISASYNSSIFEFATSNSPSSHDLNLNVYRSAIDPSFAVLSFNQPSISGTLTDSTFTTFIVHNFDSSLWDYDEVFSAGITLVTPRSVLNQNRGATASIGFKTYLTGNCQQNSTASNSTRTAESGWCQISQDDHEGQRAQNYNVASTQTNYSNQVGNADTENECTEATIYSRTSGFKDFGYLESDNGTQVDGNRQPITVYRSVIKGIPINGNLIPCPYFMPDDFVLIDLKLDASGENIVQGDTITVGPGEVYTVITGSYNQSSETSGIFFCARTV